MTARLGTVGAVSHRRFLYAACAGFAAPALIGAAQAPPETVRTAVLWLALVVGVSFLSASAEVELVSASSPDRTRRDLARRALLFGCASLALGVSLMAASAWTLPYLVVALPASVYARTAAGA